jgi:hypothetical protein
MAEPGIYSPTTFSFTSTHPNGTAQFNLQNSPNSYDGTFTTYMGVLQQVNNPPTDAFGIQINNEQKNAVLTYKQWPTLPTNLPAITIHAKIGVRVLGTSPDRSGTIAFTSSTLGLNGNAIETDGDNLVLTWGTGPGHKIPQTSDAGIGVFPSQFEMIIRTIRGARIPSLWYPTAGGTNTTLSITTNALAVGNTCSLEVAVYDIYIQGAGAAPQFIHLV